MVLATKEMSPDQQTLPRLDTVALLKCGVARGALTYGMAGRGQGRPVGGRMEGLLDFSSDDSGEQKQRRMSAGIVFLDADRRRCGLFWSRHPWIKLSGATHTGPPGGWIWSSGSTLKVRSARKVFVALFGLGDHANKA